MECRNGCHGKVKSYTIRKKKRKKVQLFKRIDLEFSFGRLQKRWYLEPFFSIVTKAEERFKP